MRTSLYCFSLMTIFLSCRHPDNMCHLNGLALTKVGKGIVIDKKENVKTDHSNEHLILLGNKRFIWQDRNYSNLGRSFFNKIELGDSIVKERGSLEMYVYRIDTSFVIDLSFPCKN